MKCRFKPIEYEYYKYTECLVDNNGNRNDIKVPSWVENALCIGAIHYIKYNYAQVLLCATGYKDDVVHIGYYFLKDEHGAIYLVGPSEFNKYYEVIG